MSGGQVAPTARDWLRVYHPRPAARVRLVCFPFASGSAPSYRPWSALLPQDVEVVAVQYPGRLDRIAEPCIADMDTMVDVAVSVLKTVLDRPIALFGHSMGAAIAHEVALRLRDLYGFDALRLFVSGRPAPQFHRGGTKHAGPDDVLWSELARLGGTSDAVLNHAELRAMLLPSLRGDYRLIETYQPGRPEPLRSPITALLGDDDPEVTLAQARAWQQHTSGGFRMKVFPGNHFYLVPCRAGVLAEVARDLTAMETS